MTLVRFGKPAPLNGIAGELESVRSDLGHTFNWRQFLSRSDDQMLTTLHGAFRFDGSDRDQALLAAICGSYDGMGRYRGKSGNIKPTATRYAYHCVATIDFCLGHSQTTSSQPRRILAGAEFPMQYSYRLLTPPTGRRYRGPLSEKEVRAARAACLARLATESNKYPEKQAMDFIADHYYELEPYFDTMIETNDISQHFLESLVETQPAAALVGGML